MKIREETMTPDEAALLLKATAETPQRAIAEPAVARLTAAIRDGHWELTHQPIAITDEGIVIDGRHRLTAIVQADQPVQVMVARGADPATFKVVDTGRSRTPGDLLRIAGHANTQALAASARYVMAAHRLRRSDAQRSWSRTSTSIRHDEIVDWVDLHGRDLEGALVTGGRVATGVGKYGMRSFMGAAVYLVRESNVPEDLQSEFFERVTDGAMLQAGSPVLALRRALLRSATQGLNQVRGPVGLAVTIKAFNAWVAGEAMHLAQFRLGIEKFPVVNPWRPDPLPVEHLPLPGALVDK